MATTLPNSAVRAHLLSSAISKRPAKVHTVAHGNPAIDPTWKLLGECMDDVRTDAKLTISEFAGVLERDERQVGKWLKGTERPQIELLVPIERFAESFGLAYLKRVSKSIRIVTQITVERLA